MGKTLICTIIGWCCFDSLLIVSDFFVVQIIKTEKEDTDIKIQIVKSVTNSLDIPDNRILDLSVKLSSDTDETTVEDEESHAAPTDCNEVWYH